MSYVDLMGDVRWSEIDHINRVEADLRAKVTHTREHVLLRRCIALIFYILAQVLPEGATKTMVAAFGRTLSGAALDELTAASIAFLAADDLALEARADSARLDAALDYEQAQTTLATLAEDDPARPELQAVIDAATPETLQLVADRAAYRQPPTTTTENPQ